MVLESIFADDYAGQQPLIAECSTCALLPHWLYPISQATWAEPVHVPIRSALQLTVRTTVGKDERSVVLAIEFPPEYPSHLPPFCRVLEGVRVDDVGFFVGQLCPSFEPPIH